MVENLCLTYGDKVFSLEDDKHYHSFPSIDSLSQEGVEAKLRQLGFGYRAGYIAKSAKQLKELGGAQYLLDLRKESYEDARESLIKLNGIGPKVADCILLMSLDKPGAIPVDTHMFQIAATKYLPHLKGYKSVTDKIYKEIGGHFRGLYGEYAGWAHSVLFSADLKHLQTQQTEDKSPTKNRKRKKCA